MADPNVIYARPLTCPQCSKSAAVLHSHPATGVLRCVRCAFSKLFLRLTGG